VKASAWGPYSLNPVAAAFILLLAGYLLGSIPFGYLVGRLRGIDVREYGSGKTGATNVLRTLGVVSGVGVFFLDALKGLAAVFLGSRLLGESYLGAVSGALGAIIGHNFPLYLCFRGGRGVATFFGSLLGLAWPVALGGGAVAILVIALSRFVSLGSILGIVAAGIIAFVMVAVGRQPWLLVLYILIGGGFIIFQHRDNISRLLSGQERRLGEVGKRREHP